MRRTSALSIAFLLAMQFSPAQASPRHKFKARPPTPASEVERAIQESLDEFHLRPKEPVIRSVIGCESGYDPYNSNGSHDGLLSQSRRYWQGRVADFNRGHPQYPVTGDPFNVFDNVRLSFWMMTQKSGLERNWKACLPT